MSDTKCSSPINEAFKQFSKDLTAKHDKYERIVKISRDVTIESKRLIFTLHNLPKQDKTIDADSLENIESRFKNIERSHFRIARELENEDSHMYHGAYTWGVQEYVEALAYFEFIINGHLIEWKDVTDRLTFTVKSLDDSRNIRLLVPLSDYILGVMDMTGEVMRYCISTLGAGDPDVAQKACNFVKFIYCGLRQIPPEHKEFNQKLEVAAQSLCKMEYGCYLAKMQNLEKKSSALSTSVVTPVDGS